MGISTVKVGDPEELSIQAPFFLCHRTRAMPTHREQANRSLEDIPNKCVVLPFQKSVDFATRTATSGLVFAGTPEG